MGWSSGSEMADDIWNAIELYIPKAARKKVAGRIVDIFEGADCDTMYESKVAEVAGRKYGEDD